MHRRDYIRKFSAVQHKKKDFEVAATYNFEEILDDEAKIVAELMKPYEKLTSAAKT